MPASARVGRSAFNRRHCEERKRRSILLRHSGMVPWHQTSDAQLRIGESRDSGFDASHRPGMTGNFKPPTRNNCRIGKKRNEKETQLASDQSLVRATACAVIEKLNPCQVTSLDLLDVLRQRIAHVAGQGKALPTTRFC